MNLRQPPLGNEEARNGKGERKEQRKGRIGRERTSTQKKKKIRRQWWGNSETRQTGRLGLRFVWGPGARPGKIVQNRIIGSRFGCQRNKIVQPLETRPSWTLPQSSNDFALDPAGRVIAPDPRNSTFPYQHSGSAAALLQQT